MKFHVILFCILCVVGVLVLSVISEDYKFSGTKEATILSYRYNGSSYQLELSVYRPDKFQSVKYTTFYDGEDSSLLNLFTDKSGKFSDILTEVKVPVIYTGNITDLNRVEIKE